MINARALMRGWHAQAYLDVMGLLRSPLRFTLYTVTDVVSNAGMILAMLLLAARFGGFGVWTAGQVLFMLGYAAVVDRASNVLFGYNVMSISRRLGRGQLDHTLVQPRPLWVALFSEGLSPVTGMVSLIPSLALLCWAMFKLPLSIDVTGLVVLVLNLAASLSIKVAFSYALGCAAFWAPRGAEEISSSAVSLVGQLASYPLDGLPQVAAIGLLTAVPVGFVAWYPARALLGLDPLGPAVAITPLAAVAFVAGVLLLFGRGLGHYRQTGSQRYSNRGHRN